MKMHKISRQNLEKDKIVLGKHWLKTYKNYFSDKENIDLFIKSSYLYIKNLKKKELDILYLGSASGLLGEHLVSFLKKKGIKAKLYLLDISEKHLKENKNKRTVKIRGDILDKEYFKNKKFDVVLMRSSLDYLPNEKLQIKALKNIKNNLKEGGIFLNCCASMPSNELRDLADRIYKSNRKIGSRHFQSKEDIEQLYKSGGFEQIKEIGKQKDMIITQEDHIKRYKIDGKQINRIQRIIEKVRKNTYVKKTKDGYRMKFIFPIYIGF